MLSEVEALWALSSAPFDFSQAISSATKGTTSVRLEQAVRWVLDGAPELSTGPAARDLTSPVVRHRNPPERRGDVPAANLTANNLAKRISDRLTEYMASPIVSVQLKEVNSYFIYVLGEVTKPGKYPLKSYANVMQGISLAGGFTQFAKKNKMKVLRATVNSSSEKHQIEIPVQYDDILNGNATPGNFYLRSGDVIVVP